MTYQTPEVQVLYVDLSNILTINSGGIAGIDNEIGYDDIIQS